MSFIFFFFFFQAEDGIRDIGVTGVQTCALPISGAAKFLAVKKYGKVELVPIDRVLYVEGAGAYAELVLDDGKRELHDKTLEKLHALLPPVFERIHKSYVVRWSTVKALHAQEGSRYEAELRNGLRLPVGRTRYKELREKLG